MDDLLTYIVDVIGEFAGGRGSKQNDYVRLGLGAILFAGLLWWSRDLWRRDRQRRDFYLMIGFSFGLGRELLLFTVKSLQLTGTVSAATLELFFPPLEHALLGGARVLISAAFLFFLLPSPKIYWRF